MASIDGRSTAADLGALFEVGSAAGMTDEQLLHRFVSRRGPDAELAFGALVRRHGPMVLATCRGVLGDRHDAEDAFQAAFLVLARRAPSLRDPARLGPWLHGVAGRTSRKVRASRSRRTRLEGRVEAPTTTDAASGPEAGLRRREEAEILHDEIGRLPDRYRAPVVLCDLEGLTQDDAARQLGCPVGTLGVRLMRARQRLRARLTRRGLAPAGLTAPPPSPGREPVPGPLATQTVRSAASFATASGAGEVIATHITVIARGVLRTMTIKTLTSLGATGLAFGLLAAATAALAVQGPAPGSKDADPAPKTKPADRGSGEARSILANGGFEDGDAGARTPDSWNIGAAISGVKYEWDRGVAHRGEASLHLKKTAPRYFPIAQWGQLVKREGAAPRLRVGAFVRAETLTKAILDVQFRDAKGKETHQWAAYIGAQKPNDPPVTHPWTYYEGVVAIPEGTELLAIGLQIYGPGDVWFDDVVAEYTEEPATDPLAPERRGDGSRK